MGMMRCILNARASRRHMSEECIERAVSIGIRSSVFQSRQRKIRTLLQRNSSTHMHHPLQATKLRVLARILADARTPQRRYIILVDREWHITTKAFFSSGLNNSITSFFDLKCYHKHYRSTVFSLARPCQDQFVKSICNCVIYIRGNQSGPMWAIFWGICIKSKRVSEPSVTLHGGIWRVSVGCSSCAPTDDAEETCHRSGREGKRETGRQAIRDWNC